jgi:peroxin-7
LKTLPVGNCTYSAAYSPSNPSIISAVSSDSQLRIFDLRAPVSAKYHLTSMIPVHAPPPQMGQSRGVPAEVLTHDWNKYNDTVIATGGVDRLLRTFDIRNPSGGPLSVMYGHEYAVRRLAWSPHASDILLTASYDMTVRVWNDGSNMPPDPTMPVKPGMQLGIMNRHTEFVTGVDWCLFGAGGWVASVGWDERVLLWDAHMLLQNR